MKPSPSNSNPTAGSVIDRAIPWRCLRGFFLRFVGLLGCVSLGLVGCGKQREYVSLRAESPNGQYAVEIVELPADIDRNFQVRLRYIPGKLALSVLLSPDEGRPGTERIVWSKDSTRFVLLGRNFSVEPHARPGGTNEALYLLYDVTSGSAWCNASQKRLPNFYRTQLTNSTWIESF